MKAGERRCDRSHANGAVWSFEQAESSLTIYLEPPSFPDSFRNLALEFAECRWKKADQGVGTRAGEENAKSKQELRKSVLHSALRDAVAVGKVDEEDGTRHYDHDAESADADENAREQGKSTGELRQSYQESNCGREVCECREAMNTGAAKGAKENGAAVIEKGESTGQTEDKKGEVKLR